MRFGDGGCRYAFYRSIESFQVEAANMSGKHNFQTLKNHATKEYKFKQEYSIGAFRPGNSRMGDSINALELSPDEFNEISGGVCGALAAAWLKEQLGGSGSRQFAGAVQGDVHLTRNRDTVLDVMPQYRAYVKAGQNASVLDQFGFGRRDRNPQGVMVTEMSQTAFRPVPIAAPSLARACSRDFLTGGRAVFMEFSVFSTRDQKKLGGHAVAAYRSQGGTLLFFDSNCGVYTVKERREFFEQYVKCYAGIKYKIEFDQRDGFTYIDK